MNYNLTWSTDGLINEYCNPCQAIHDGRLIDALPLDGLESFSLDGVHYEAFNTSGGLGTLCETLRGQVAELNYRTIRYRGHRELMAFLLQDLRLSERREMLKDILERAVPITLQDVVVIFCNVMGWQEGRFTKWSDARKLYSQSIAGRTWSAIQVTTAAGVCAAVGPARRRASCPRAVSSSRRRLTCTSSWQTVSAATTTAGRRPVTARQSQRRKGDSRMAAVEVARGEEADAFEPGSRGSNCFCSSCLEYRYVRSDTPASRSA